jgi:hypothetical protein
VVLLGLIALVVVVVLTIAAFRRLTRPPDIGPESSDAARQNAEMKERQRNIAGFWGGFLP